MPKRQWELVSRFGEADGYVPKAAPHEVKLLPFPSQVDEYNRPVWPACEGRFWGYDKEWHNCTRKATHNVQAVSLDESGAVDAYDIWRKLCHACAGFFLEGRQLWNIAHASPLPSEPAGAGIKGRLR